MAKSTLRALETNRTSPGISMIGHLLPAALPNSTGKVHKRQKPEHKKHKNMVAPHIFLCFLWSVGRPTFRDESGSRNLREITQRGQTFMDTRAT
jgi:hypothetical protein